MTSLHDAARNGDLVMLHSLLAQGKDVNVRDKHSRTALHMAAWAGQDEAVKALLAANANKGATAMDDMNALHFAAQKGNADGNLEACKTLLDAGIKVGIRTRKGQTALHIAASKGHLQLVKLLLQRKADPSMKNRREETAIDAAATDEVRRILQEALDSRPKPAVAVHQPTSRPNARKRGLQDGETHAAEPTTKVQEQPGEKEQTKAKQAKVSLSHLGDEEDT